MNEYEGLPLEVTKLAKIYPCLKIFNDKDPSKNRSRRYIKCTLCEKHIVEAKKLSKNGTCPIADGIRADDTKKVKTVIDHLISKSHKQIVELDKLQSQFEEQNESHPWIRVLKKVNQDTLTILLRLAVDVYNDSKYLTLSANSWPGRSLSQLHADEVINSSPSMHFKAFEPTAAELHYRSPIAYKEMLDIIGTEEMSKVAASINKSVVFSVQIDGSTDSQMHDNKFVTCRVINEDSSLCTYFLRVGESQLPGARGLKEVLLQAIGKNASSPLMETQKDSIDVAKLVAITTDGESANTGRKAGLWQLLQDELDKKLVTVWCVAHRSDLALENVVSSVPELTLWRANLSGILTYYRKSARHTKSLAIIFPEYRAFPRHFEVRFAEHIRNEIQAVIKNLPYCRKQWQNIMSDSEEDKKDKNIAKGMLNMWEENSLQFQLTLVMGDICRIFQSLQENFQKSNIILSDIITVLNIAVTKLELMINAPYPGGFEACEKKRKTTIKEDTSSKRREKVNSNVTTFSRRFESIRQEIVLSSINLLKDKVNDEQAETLKTAKALCVAGSAAEIISVGENLLSNLFPNEVSEFADSVCESWPLIDQIPTLPANSDIGSCTSTRLKKMFVVSKGPLKKLLGTLIVATPHSMQVERVVSSYNIVKSDHRAGTKIETINKRLNIALNGCGTAYFNPRPSVIKFLQIKNRREGKPEAELYKERFYMKSFFEKDNVI